jgi:hypothetical protein
VLAVEPKGPADGVVTSRFTVRKQDGAAVLVATLKTLVVRKGPT